MTKITSVAAYLVKKIWLLLAILLVLFALLISAARYALPHIEHNKHLLEDYINQRYGVNLTIKSVHAVWQRSGPSIVLNSVSMTQNDASPVGLNIRQVYVELDFWQSITQRMISSTRFELRGLKLDVDADRFERAGDGNFPVVDALKNLFLEQLQSFSLEEGEVILTKNSEKQSFIIDQLTWNNSGKRHQGLGQVRVADVSSNSASFIIDVTGNKDAFEGVFYARAEDLDISPWVSDLIKTKRPLSQSRANFEIWADVQSNGITGVQAQFEESLLEWGGGEYSTLVTGIRGGNIEAVPTRDGWSVRVDQLVVDSGNETIEADFVGKVSNSGDAVVSIVKPVQINPFLMLLPLFMDDTSEEEIRGLNPTGQLATLELQLRNRRPEFTAKILDLSWEQAGKTPGLTSLDADLYWYKDSGAVYLKSENSILSADNVIKQNLDINTFSANLFFHAQSVDDEKQWVVTGKNLLLDSEQVVVKPAFRSNLTTGDMDIIANVEPLALNEVSDFFPVSLMGANTDNFLTRAFVGKGEVTKAQVLWHGNPKQYPFADNSGIFQAYVDVEDSDFVFSSKWPALNELDLSVRFENAGLVMVSEKGTLAGIDVSAMSAEIPRLHPSSMLTINAQGAGTGESLTELMKQSSIANSLGKVLDKDVQVSGPLSASLQLDIPFRGKDVRVQGAATLNDNSVYITSTRMKFDDANGTLTFDNANIDASGLTASLLGQPVEMSLKGRQKESYDVNVNLKGLWHVHPLVEYVKNDFKDYVDGETNWQADVNLSLSNSDFYYNAQINADLTATQSLLPAPFDTIQGSSLPLQINSEGNLQASSVVATLGDNVHFDGVLPHKEMQFSRALLSLGDAELGDRGTGFSIAAAVEKADIVQWFSTLQTLILPGERVGDSSTLTAKTTTASSTKSTLFGVPSRIFVTADTLTGWGHSLKNVSLTAREQDNDWLLQVDASKARASIRINSDINAQGIDIDADYLVLDKPISETTSSQSEQDESQEIGKSEETQIAQKKAEVAEVDPLDLPPIYFHCSVCSVHGVDLGEVTLDVAKTDQGMHIRQLLTRSSDANLTASGYWQHEGDDITTRLNGTLVSPDVGQMLKQHGVTSGIKDSEANVNFDLSWPSAPFDFSVAKVNGDVDWTLTDGYLTEVSDKGSRIFTLFSLNSLVRKLSLDFRDVFATGFFYDKMGGSLQIANGNAFTDDTEIDGGAGEIEIKGYTDLNTGGLNYNISFAPNVTGNLPFLVYFLATPPTALAALALDQVLTSAKVISNVNYKVSGTIANPQFDEVERHSKDISLPANVSPETTSPLDRPLTEDDLRRVKMEVIDG
ncbi:YhdP family protein [Alteromonas sp. 1_MG-2023]|uniref:YhdP family protein n=1 Tax=Alteromonas sp. 1_MG-2023 TaxID=3062669 RepID=UPI0026E179E0|nr:YhdP family protein [Alteromonas sp. 1_MG-2023]MDO6566705.1 YhdP family protein [Alteromonas sp. 1_MG-2023]